MNKNVKIGVCSRSFSSNKILRKELLEKFGNVKFNDAGNSLAGDELVSFLSDCDGAVIALEYVNESILEKLPNLSFVGKYGVGLDKLDFEAFDRFNVKLGWTPGVNSTAVSELTINLALTMVRNTNESADLAKQLIWKQVLGKQLSSLAVGVIGYGHVGSKVANLAKAFGSDVYVYDKVDKTNECDAAGVTFVSLDTLLRQADLVSIHVPGNSETYHMIGTAELEKMKAGSYLINTARGGIVDEKAVLSALDNNHLASVGLDVLEVEPPIDSALLLHPKALVTTHIGGSSEEAVLAMGRAAIAGLESNEKASNFSIYR